MKTAIKNIISKLLVNSGYTRVSRQLNSKRGAVILYGHRVCENTEDFLVPLTPGQFEEQIVYLKKHYRIIPLSKLTEYYENDKTVPGNTVVLTFDDGFGDNYEFAYPIMKKHGISATIFLVTGSIIDGIQPWPQRLGAVLKNSENTTFRYKLFGDKEYHLGSKYQRREVFFETRKYFASMPRKEREEHLHQFSDMLDVKPPDGKMLTWNEVREMQLNGIEFGSHTYSHPWLSDIPAEEAASELERSMTDLKEILDLSNPPLCFPAGSYNSEIIAMARETGYRSAFQRKRDIRVNNINTTDLFSLSRVGLVNGPRYLLEAEIDGPFHAIRGLFRNA